MLAASCLGFEIGCETIVKGALAVTMGFVLFIGSVLIMLSAVFGRRMGYLVLAVSFFGWMMILSTVWLTGFLISQGPDTPVNLGPRGTEPAWVVESIGTSPEPVYEAFAQYPGGGWREPGTNDNDTASVQSVTSSAQAYMAEQANAEIGKNADEPGALQTSDFTVQNIEFFATDDGVSLAAAHAFFTDGGPILTVYLRHDSGSVPRYSWMFLIGATVLFGAHVPFLDRAERKRKEILTGGTAPPWYGPA
jgi:hypothetical protein